MDNLKSVFIALRGLFQRLFSKIWYRQAAPEYLQPRWIVNMGDKHLIIRQDYGFLEQLRVAGKKPIFTQALSPGQWRYFDHGTFRYEAAPGERYTPPLATCYDRKGLKKAMRLYREKKAREKLSGQD